MSDIALPLNGVPELPLGGRLLGDEALARLAGRGSERAFAALYERHHQAIYRYCRSILRDEHDAQDAMQSAMTRAYAALCTHERELAVKPWLFRIAHNEAISILRKRRPEQELSEEHEHLDSDVEHALDRRERLSTLVADLQALPERQRAALLMRELSGLSIQEISAALQMSPGAAKQTLFEARSSLHELAQGRAMQCESVMQAISQRDGRVLRSRRIRAHLRACAECREFREAIGTRSADLAAIAPPLPASVAATLLARLLAHGGGHGGGLAAAGSGTSIGSHALASLFGKGVAGVAVLAAATAGTAHFVASHAQHPKGSSSHLSRSGAARVRSGEPAGRAEAGASREAPAKGAALGAGASRAGMSERSLALRAAPLSPVESSGRSGGSQEGRRGSAQLSPSGPPGALRAASRSHAEAHVNGSNSLHQTGAREGGTRSPHSSQPAGGRQTSGASRSAGKRGGNHAQRGQPSHARAQRTAPSAHSGSSKAGEHPSSGTQRESAPQQQAVTPPVRAKASEARAAVERH